MKTKRLAIVGCGKLTKIVVNALTDGYLPDYKLVGVMSRSQEKANAIAKSIENSECHYTCKVCSSLDELLALKPNYLIESASPSALKMLAIPVLKNGTSLVVLSIGAFADTEFYKKVEDVARQHNQRVHIVSGATGGFDVLRTVSLMGNTNVSFDTEKGPNSLKNTPKYNDSLKLEKSKVFEGNAQEAIALFPTKVNVSVAASLASVGPENIKVSVTSIPEFIGDNHRIEINNDQVHAVISVHSKTAEIAAWSVVNTLRNITSPIVF
ncbi:MULTISPECIES: aspartate dehydrogenase domain-containing protein [unclassified Carboxylicivirga]|uniref:aspartate dehydrogenase domain-containing protein n=1 Tax=Carboxylicivirga TaxID=1628153 RepID=UPI003D3497BD